MGLLVTNPCGNCLMIIALTISGRVNLLFTFFKNISTLLGAIIVYKI